MIQVNVVSGTSIWWSFSRSGEIWINMVEVAGRHHHVEMGTLRIEHYIPWLPSYEDKNYFVFRFQPSRQTDNVYGVFHLGNIKDYTLKFIQRNAPKGTPIMALKEGAVMEVRFQTLLFVCTAEEVVHPDDPSMILFRIVGDYQPEPKSVDQPVRDKRGPLSLN